MHNTCKNCGQKIAGNGQMVMHLKNCGVPFDAAKFWSRMDKRADGCWLWTGCTYNAGYGSVSWKDSPIGKRRMVGTNRVAWMLTHGPIPEGLDVCHTCDRPLCCNPAHLWLGTHQDNISDAQRKGRNARGERSNRNKLTEASVREIRRDWRKAGNGRRCRTNGNELARRYGVQEGAITAVIYGRTWKHVS